MKQTRMDLIAGSVLLTVSLVLSHITGLALYLFAPLLAGGAVLFAEGVMSLHVYRDAEREERRYETARKAPKPTTLRVDQTKLEARTLILDWAAGKPTTKRYASEKHSIPEGRWQQIVDLAVRLRLGQLTPAQGGNATLRMHASLNETLDALDRHGYTYA